MNSEKIHFIHQCCGTVMIYCNPSDFPVPVPNRIQIWQTLAKNPAFPVLEAALFPKKSVSHFYLLTFEFHFMLDPDPNPVPEPEQIPVPVPQHCLHQFLLFLCLCAISRRFADSLSLPVPTTPATDWWVTDSSDKLVAGSMMPATRLVAWFLMPGTN
jgi:hypothetical protein